jgi:Flp pilus assembly protein TadB
MERQYDNLKLRRNKRFKTTKEEIDYFEKLGEENLSQYKYEIKQDIEDELHVYWSRKVLSMWLGIVIFILVLILNLSFILTIAIHAIILTSFFVSLWYNFKLNRKCKEYIVVDMMTDYMLYDN